MCVCVRLCCQIASFPGNDSFIWSAGGMVRIQQHTFGLARYSYVMLSSLLHSNGQPVAHVYCDNEFQDPSSQGAVLNFNVLDGHGGVVGYSQVGSLQHDIREIARGSLKQYSVGLLPF